MIQVKGQLLQTVARALRLPLAGGAETYFDDDNLQQVLDIGPLIRRGGSLGVTGGMWNAGIVNTHGAANTQSNSVDPYAVSSPTGSYPSPVPTGYDIWLIGGQVFTSTAGANMGSGWLGLDFPAGSVAFGIASGQLIVAAFDGTTSLGGVAFGTLALPIGPDGASTAAVRIPRGVSLRFDSTSTGAATTTARFILGLFPEGMGQDGAV